VVGISVKTYRRWKENPQDRRKGTRKKNPRALTEEERAEILRVCCSERYEDCAPREIVARLQEEGVYLASVRTFYRVLKQEGKLPHRGNTRPPRKPYTPPELKADGPDQVYSWDITWLPTEVRGLFLYAYVVIDVWSREVVGWSIQEEESEACAMELFERLKRERNLKGVWIHADNGHPMRGSTFSVWLQNLGMFLSHSRPTVKNDNPYIESLFKTLKYHASYPGRFTGKEHAREWMGGFLDWYNTVHRHSGIGFVTPQQRKRGEDKRLFEKRNETLKAAWERLKHRFPKSGPKLWEYKRVVYLNPSKETRNYMWRKAS